MRPQTLNYWNEAIPARTQFKKSTVGNLAKFAKIVVMQQISVGACAVVDIGLENILSRGKVKQATW